MATTLYASFDDASLAEKAAGALMDHGVRAEDISLVSKGGTNVDNINNVDSGDLNTPRDYTAHSATLDERRTDTGYASSPGYTNAPANAGEGTWDAGRSAGNRVAEGADRLAAGASRAVGADNAAAGFQRAANERDAIADAEAGESRSEFNASTGAGYRTDNYNTPVAHTYDTPTTETYSRTDTDYENRDVDDRDKTEMAAKGGISTTTPGDAASGAAKGAGIGLGLGILAGIASILIPGVGLVTGGGALATAIAAAAATTAAGAVAGGVHGYLMDQGVPDEVAQDYDRAIKNGGAVMAVQCPSNDVDEATCREILGKYGAMNVNTFGGSYGADYTRAA